MPMVDVYQLWPTKFTRGFVGVDVFLAISGFFFSAHLIKAPPRWAADFVGFWTRRIRRLLPAAFVVLACAVGAVRMLVPDAERKDVGRQFVSSAFYVCNWALASTSVVTWPPTLQIPLSSTFVRYPARKNSRSSGH